MGVKMGFAMDKAGTEWTANAYQKGMGVPPLKCKFCPALVAHNPSHSRDLDEKSILVPAYFKLLPGGSHAHDCAFAVKEEVVKIVKQSKDLFESIRDGEYRLRLAMIKEAFAGLPSSKAQDEGRGKGAAEPGNRTGTTYIKGAGKLPGYINSAKRVLQLRALCEDDSEIAKHIELVFEGNTVVHWPQFYFETSRHYEAFNTIARNTVQHPIALHGYVSSKRVGVGKSGQSVLNLLKDRYQPDQSNPENGIGVEVSVWSKDAGWFAGIEEGDEIVVLGLWSAAARLPEPAKKNGRYSTYTTNRLSVNLVLMAQMIKLPTR